MNHLGSSSDPGATVAPAPLAAPGRPAALLPENAGPTRLLDEQCETCGYEGREVENGECDTCFDSRNARDRVGPWPKWDGAK